VFVARQARTKDAPYPRQSSASAHLRGWAGEYSATQRRGMQANRFPFNRTAVCYRCGRGGHVANQCYKPSSSSALPVAAAESRP
jgi:Zinc knuckle